MLSTFLATAAGKVLAGSAIAAASVGGLAAADVVELPLPSGTELPAEVETVETEPVETETQVPENETETDVPETNDAETDGVENAPTDLPDEAVVGQDFAADMQLWADCVATNAAAQGDDETRTTDDEFDPKAGCEDLRPTPPSGEDEGSELEGADNAENADNAEVAEEHKPVAADAGDDRGTEARESAPTDESAPADDAPAAQTDDAPATQTDDGSATQADDGADNAPVDAGPPARP